MSLSSLLALLSLILPLAMARPTLESPSERDVNVRWPYGSEKIRGVNIGGVSGFHLV